MLKNLQTKQKTLEEKFIELQNHKLQLEQQLNSINEELLRLQGENRLITGLIKEASGTIKNK